MATDLNNLIDKILFQISQKRVSENVQKILDVFFEKTPEESIVEHGLQKFSETSDFWELNIISYLLAQCKSDVSKESIQKYLLESELNDYKRNRLVLVLQEHPNFEFNNFASIYPHKIKLVNYAVRSLVNNIDDHGENLEEVTCQLQPKLNDRVFCENLILNLCYIYKKKSIWLLGYLAESASEDIALLAINALKKQTSDYALKILNNLAIHREKHRSHLEEQKPDCSQAVSDCFISWLDSYGNQMIVCCSEENDKYCISTFMINQEKGLQSFLSLENLSRYKQEAMINDWKNSADIREIPLDKAKKILRGALWKNKGQHVTPAFLLRDIFPGEDLIPQEYIVDLETTEDHYRLIQNSSYLVKEFPFDQWWMNFQDCREYVTNNIAEQKNVDYAVLQNFISEFWEQRRNEIAQRLLLTADIMHTISSEKYQKQIQTCLALNSCLLSGKQMRDIPFIRQLALINIRQIQKQQ
ncbi:hypothetical protein [Candidatus Uabimicrobium amorphum]|uniref:Uncharacterized protein n=1 Tax=Uabimicrobium amorphum TaxID=2596890 RepID=A0A5S9F7R6_UABAM|nr:hypothetical protein [Candidatus Uabimicrobium amorphum]BBM87522.1 hypothetical protein UABAM_05934 [Candidatus Uabimicrobium amorphum]